MRHAVSADLSPAPTASRPPWPITGAAWSAVILILAIVAAYANGLRGPFVLDDITSIRDNPSLLSLSGAFSPPAGKGLTSNGRPLVNASLALNHALTGEATWSYHVLNLAIHGAAALVLLGLVRRTVRLASLDLPEGFPLAVSLLWALHPLTTEAVTYIVQRAESLMGLSYLATLYAFARMGGAEREGAPGGRWAALCVLACLTGMACKEVMVSAPLMVLLYDRTFVSGSFREGWRQHRRVHLALAATWALLAYEVIVTGNRGGTAGLGTAVSWWQYALTQAPALVHYLRLAVWPHPLVFDYGIGLATQPWGVVPQALPIVALLCATCWALARRPRLGFLGAFFFAVLAPTSSVVPVASQTMAEHRMYLPLIAVILAAALVFVGFARRLRLGRGVLLTCSGVLAVLLGLGTALRNRDYRSNVALWTSVTEAYPRNMRGRYNLGCAYDEALSPEKAVAQYVQVTPGSAQYIDAQENLAKDLVKLGRSEEALVPLEVAAHARPTEAQLQCSLGIALLETGRPQPASEHFREALRLQPGMEEATYQWGEALLRLGQPAEALPLLEKTVRARPRSPEASMALGNALAQVGRLGPAAEAYRRAIALSPGGPEAHNNLGSVLLQAGDPAAALAEFREAIRLKPAFAPSHTNAGNALLALGRENEALAELRQAVTLDPTLVDARYDLANRLSADGDLDGAIAGYREVVRRKPDFAQAWNNLGIALARSGDGDGARRAFRQALATKADYPEARDNLDNLEAALRAQR